jgi:hypothetical protein
MKTLSPFFLISLAFLLSPVSFAQANCNKYVGGVISCTGPGDYRLEGREHINGQTSYYDNRGNVGTVTEYLNGAMSVTPSQIGSAPPPPGALLFSSSKLDQRRSKVIPVRPNLLFD